MIEETWNMVKAFQKTPAAVAAYLALAGVVVGTVLAFGGIPLVFGGFAKANRVNRIAIELNERVARLAKQTDNNYQTIQTEQRAHWAEETAANMLTLDAEKCHIPTLSGRLQYDKELQHEMLSYYKDTGAWYPLPTCRNL